MSYSEAGKLGAMESSKNVAIRKRQRIDTYNKTPKLCKFCINPLSYDKRYNNFCNQSCGASFNNKGVRRNNKNHIKCPNCEEETLNPKFCSLKCTLDFNWNETKEKLNYEGVDTSDANRQGKRYLIEISGGKCQICGLFEWQGQQMPLVLDHIDGNSYNNLLSNLRVICNNCDALLPTFKGRNKGSGRFKRAERYKYEKETVGNIEEFRSIKSTDI